MSDYVTFEARIEPMVWGKATYTVLRLPEQVMETLGHPKRVEGEINDFPVNLAPQKAPVIEDAFLWAGKALLDEAGIEPGQPVEVRLRVADPDAVEVPGDVIAALRSAGLTGSWNHLTPGRQRGMLQPIIRAKRLETRKKRIASLLDEVRATA